MKEELFNDFKSPSKADWLKVFSKELKQELSDFPTFEWEPGLDLPVAGMESAYKGMPGQFPNASGWKKEGNTWEINQGFSVSDGNDRILQALQNDVSSITLSGKITADAMKSSLKKVLPQYIEIHFQPESGSVSVKDLSSWVQESGADAKACRLFLGYDPISKNEDASKIMDYVKEARAAFPTCRPLAVTVTSYEQQGASLTDRLALALAHGNEYLAILTEGGLSIDEASACVAFYLPVSVSFLHEIAALRAFRSLWANVVRAYDPQHACTTQVYVQTVVSDAHWSVYDEYNNLIRATIQSMSAIMGGCDSLCVTPFDVVRNTQTDFSLRLARNIQLILKEESFMHYVNDPAAGSYYIESLTDTLCQNAWKGFVALTKEGGYSLDKADILIQATRKERMDAIKSGKRPVIGLNKYRNPKEQDLSGSSDRLTSAFESELKGVKA